MSEVRAVRRPTARDVTAAAGVIGRHLRPTPTVEVDLPGCAPMWFKLETLQPTGSFKVRGALAALAAVGAGTEVVTASAGNHGLGVAWAAARLGLQATVVVPETASSAKVEALRRFPVRLVQVGSSYDEAEAHALALSAEGSRYVSPYNDPDVIAGQATVGVELDRQLDGPLQVVCPVGGGGLAAGLGLWASTRPEVRVIGVEAAASPAVSRALAGRGTAVKVRPTLADGLAGNLEGAAVTVPLIADHVSSLVAADEPQIAGAIRTLAHEVGLVVEGSAAVAVAAVTAGLVELDQPGRTVVVITGRNIAADRLTRILTGPLSREGRESRVSGST